MKEKQNNCNRKNSELETNTVQLRNSIETILNTANQSQRKNQPFRASRISLNP